MHRIIQEGLEDYLSGRVRRNFELHLEQCVPCRTELEQIGSVSSMFRESFAPAAELKPSANFYARLSSTIENRKPVSPWAFFSIDAVFGRRVAFASLMALAVAGGFLISHESDAAVDLQGPEAIIAQQDPAAQDAAPQDATVNRDRMMVTLASYEH